MSITHHFPPHHDPIFPHMKIPTSFPELPNPPSTMREKKSPHTPTPFKPSTQHPSLPLPKLHTIPPPFPWGCFPLLVLSGANKKKRKVKFLPPRRFERRTFALYFLFGTSATLYPLAIEADNRRLAYFLKYCHGNLVSLAASVMESSKWQKGGKKEHVTS